MAERWDERDRKEGAGNEDEEAEGSGDLGVREMRSGMVACFEQLRRWQMRIHKDLGYVMCCKEAKMSMLEIKDASQAWGHQKRVIYIFYANSAQSHL